MACLLLLVVLLVQLMLTGLRGCACFATVVLWGMRGILSLIVLPLLPCSDNTQAGSQAALTP